MEVKPSQVENLSDLMKAYATARTYMRSHGNLTQWINGYPTEELIIADIEAGNSYTIWNRGAVAGVFYFLIGVEPTYMLIENGNWHHRDPYGAIHRLASNGTIPGVSATCFNFCLERINHLRIDTHQDNLPMQRAVENFGFKKCGTIYVADGTPRLAYDYFQRKRLG